jgi:hypothetical protein
MDPMETFVPLTFRRRGVQRVAADDRHVHDVTLLDGVARAFYWQHLLDEGRFTSITDIASAEGIDRGQASKIAQLARLAPDIIDDCAAGKARGITLQRLIRSPVPVAWDRQRAQWIIGSGAPTTP